VALTRAQLLSGNSTQGTVLPGEVQAVTAGAGIVISPLGVLGINVADPAFNALVRTNNTSAYNAYVWPGGPGTNGQQLTTDGSGNLFWSDSDGIPWTAKGQLIVGTGIGTDTLLSVGADSTVLLADSSTATGFVYSDSSTGAMLVPVGDTAQQPTSPIEGQIRYNTDDDQFEGYSGNPLSWQPLGGGQPTGGGNDKIFFTNSQDVTVDYTLPTAPLLKNAVSAGPVTIAAGITVTVPAGQSWSIV
jgi:hypothetical protein